MKHNYEHHNEYMLSLVDMGCLYVYEYDDSKILTEISHNERYEDGLEAKDICIVQGDAIKMDSWELAKVSRLNKVNLIHFYPNFESAMKDYAEYMILFVISINIVNDFIGSII